MMARQCEHCGEEFETLSRLRLHDCVRPHSDGDAAMTVLDDWSADGEMSHREIAQQLLPRLEEKMPEQEYYVDFQVDLQRAVLDSLTRELDANLTGADWGGKGFEEPADFLDAGAVARGVADEIEWYFEDDQTGKSWGVMQVIFEYAEKYDLVERGENSSD